MPTSDYRLITRHIISDPDSSRKYRALQKELQNALIEEFHADRKHGHSTRYRGVLLHSTLDEIGMWATGGFRDDQAPSSRKRATTGVFIRIASFYGNEIQGAMDWATRRIVTQDPFRIPLYLLKLGGPAAVYELVEGIVRLLDMWYLGVHGDYALAVASWLVDTLQIKPYVSSVRSSKGSASGMEERIAHGMWQWAGGEAYSRLVHERQKEFTAWIADKPYGNEIPNSPKPPSMDLAGHLGYTVNAFLIPRLDRLMTMIGGDALEYGGKKVKVFETAGSYPRGGRKPPSVSHGTTYGIDLDLEIANAPKLSSEASARSAIKGWRDICERFTRAGVDVGTGSLALISMESQGTPLGFTEDFIPAVIFTQAIILTMPSRIHFGDHLVLVAAVGAILDGLSAGEEPITINTQIDYEPQGHYNHWHVDWIEEKVLTSGYAQPAPEYAFYDYRKVKPLKGESHPLPTRSQLVRPVYIPKSHVAAGTVGEIDALHDRFVTNDTGAVSFPIGGDKVTDPEHLVKWADKYYFNRLGVK